MSRYPRRPRDAGRIGLEHWRRLYGDPPPKNEKAPSVAANHVEAGETDKQQASTNSPTANPATQPDDESSIAKWGAIALFAHHLLPLERVQELFDRNPRWRSA
jgi:hypothetical protein